MIEISKSPTADTRTCDFTKVSREQLYLSSQLHINDVQRALAFFSYLLDDASRRHDFDKLSDIDGFHADFLTGFTNTTWWDRHRKLNRHHLNLADGVPEDVNLIDVLDMIADGVMAGAARSGVEKVYRPELPDDVLRRAFENTFSLLLTQVRVRDADDAPAREEGPQPVVVPDVPGPDKVCWKQAPNMVRCTYPQGHEGPHQWEHDPMQGDECSACRQGRQLWGHRQEMEAP